MRIELKEETAEETPKKDENDIRNKHESDLTKKEKRELERMKLGSMSLGGKLQYIWAYYKPQLFGLIGVIADFFYWKRYLSECTDQDLVICDGDRFHRLCTGGCSKEAGRRPWNFR